MVNIPPIKMVMTGGWCKWHCFTIEFTIGLPLITTFKITIPHLEDYNCFYHFYCFPNCFTRSQHTFGVGAARRPWHPPMQLPPVPAMTAQAAAAVPQVLPPGRAVPQRSRIFFWRITHRSGILSIRNKHLSIQTRDFRITNGSLTCLTSKHWN